MSQTAKISRNNTTVIDNQDFLCVTLHNTEIVRYDKRNRVLTLHNGGWTTATTASRMTQVANAKELPFRVWRKHGEMFAQVGERVEKFSGPLYFQL